MSPPQPSGSRGADDPLARLDRSQLFLRIDSIPELRYSQIVYVDPEQGTTVLRQRTPVSSMYHRVVLLHRQRPGQSLTQSPQQTARSRFWRELAGTTLSCTSAVLSWTVVGVGAGAAPLTGGASLIVTGLGVGAATASTVQCFAGIARVVSEESADWMDRQSWYAQTNRALDIISLAGAAASTAATIKAVMAVRTATSKSLIQVLKGLTRQERARLTEEIIQSNNPGISGQRLKEFIVAGKYPRRYTELRITSGLKTQMRDAASAAFSYAGSLYSGCLNEVTMAVIEQVDTMDDQ